MKILHIITSLRTGGAEKLMVEILPRFKERGIVADLLLFDGSPTPFRKELESEGIRIFDFGIGGNVYNPKHILKLRKIMREYDIIHTHNTAPQFFAAIARSNSSKLVTTEHGGSNRRRKYGIFRKIDKMMYDRYNHIICISDQAEINLKGFVGGTKAHISIVYNGVDVQRCANALPFEEMRQNLPAGGKAILMVAGFRWEKDQDTVIKSIPLLPNNFHLFFAGDGVRRTECEQLSKTLRVDDRVHFLGMCTNIPNLLKASDYIVLSSHFEGLSLSSVEGMSVGKPFIASDVDGLREVVKGYGILFPHQDSEALANEILRLDADKKLYEEIASQCGKRAREFDISKMTEGYIEIYNKLISK